MKKYLVIVTFTFLTLVGCSKSENKDIGDKPYDQKATATENSESNKNYSYKGKEF